MKKLPKKLICFFTSPLISFFFSPHCWYLFFTSPLIFFFTQIILFFSLQILFTEEKLRLSIWWIKNVAFLEVAPKHGFLLFPLLFVTNLKWRLCFCGQVSWKANVCNYQGNQQLWKSKSNFTFWECWNQITVENQKEAKQRIKESLFKVQRIKRIRKCHFSNIRIHAKSKLQSSNKMMNLIPKK